MRKCRWGVRWCASCVFAAFVWVLACTDVHELQMEPRSRLELTIVLDGDTLAAPTESLSIACLREAGPLLLQFRRTYDPLPGAVDDELFLLLEFRLDDPDAWPLGVDVDVATADSVDVRIGITCFCPPPLETLAPVAGTLTIDSIGEFGVWGSTYLLFKDPTNVNSVVSDSVVVDLRFRALPFSPGCQPPPTLRAPIRAQ